MGLRFDWDFSQKPDFSELLDFNPNNEKYLENNNNPPKEKDATNSLKIYFKTD